MISYETAKKLEEAGVKWSVEFGDYYGYENDGDVYIYPSTYPDIARKPVWFLRSDQLKALIHEMGHERICTWHDLDKVVVSTLEQVGSTRKGAYAKADTEDEALALCLLEIIELKESKNEKPKICGECNNHPFKSRNGIWFCFNHPESTLDLAKQVTESSKECPNFQPRDKS